MRITSWRIVQTRHLSSAFSGEGAKNFPGRWNERGTPVIYTAGSLSLAVIEMLVHLGDADFLNMYMSIPVSFDDSICSQLAESNLPSDWTVDPAPLSTRAVGTKWISDGMSAVLAVPSAVVHIETIFILNPRHPDFSKITIGDAEEFRLDPRLLKTP